MAFLVLQSRSFYWSRSRNNFRLQLRVRHRNPIPLFLHATRALQYVNKLFTAMSIHFWKNLRFLKRKRQVSSFCSRSRSWLGVETVREQESEPKTKSFGSATLDISLSAFPVISYQDLRNTHRHQCFLLSHRYVMISKLQC